MNGRAQQTSDELEFQSFYHTHSRRPYSWLGAGGVDMLITLSRRGVRDVTHVVLNFAWKTVNSSGFWIPEIQVYKRVLTAELGFPGLSQCHC